MYETLVYTTTSTTTIADNSDDAVCDAFQTRANIFEGLETRERRDIRLRVKRIDLSR